MHKWLTLSMKWSGLGLAVLAAITLIYVRVRLPALNPDDVAPGVRYWFLLMIGIVSALVGFVADRRRRCRGI